MEVRFELKAHPGSSYTVEEHELGIVVRGELPIDSLVKLTAAWKKRGYDTVAFGVATALGATIAVCAAKDVAEWEAEINQQVGQRMLGDQELTWLYGTDAGISSMTIFSMLASSEGVRTAANIWLNGRHNVPHDPADFGRCHRLLERFPGWSERLGQVADHWPRWKPLVDNWDRLTALYLEESPTGKCPKLYAEMKRLEKIPNE